MFAAPFLLQVSSTVDFDSPSFVSITTKDNRTFLALTQTPDVSSAAVFIEGVIENFGHILRTQNSLLSWSRDIHDGAITIFDKPEFACNCEFNNVPGHPADNVFQLFITATANRYNTKPVGSLLSPAAVSFVLGVNFWDDPNIDVEPLYFRFINFDDASPKISTALTCTVKHSAEDPTSVLTLNSDGTVTKADTGKNTFLWYDVSTHKLAIMRDTTTPRADMPIWLSTTQDPVQGRFYLTWQNVQSNAVPFYWSTLGVWYVDPTNSGYGENMCPVQLTDNLVNIQGTIPTQMWVGFGDMTLLVQWQAVNIPSNYDLLKSMLVEITDKTNPNFIACQGGPGHPETQVCFYNHSASDPSTPVFPSISYDPNTYIGYNRAALGLPSLSGLQTDPMLYLTTPNDAMQLNQMQVSTCLQDDCGCPGQNPDTCKNSPDGYCRCADSSHQNDICGFQCRPGLKPHKLNDCRYDPVNLINIVHYQCFPEIFVGTTDAAGAQSCCSYVGPAVNQPKGPKFNTMEACYENFVTKCPPGYEFHANLARPGCYRTRDWTELLACNTTGHCPGDAGQCANDSTWHASCSGSCDGHCDCFCEDWSQVPPFGYYCDNGGHNDKYSRNNPKWIQNKSSSWLSIPRGSVSFNFGHTGAWDYGKDSFCQIGTTGYGPDYIGPSGVSTCTDS